MLLLRAVLNILVRNSSPRGLVCFRYLLFSLSGPLESMDLFVLCDACLTVFVNCLVKQFANMFGCGC